MNFFSINKKTPAFIFSFFVFALLPLIYSDRLLDPELSLRFIWISLTVLLFFVYFFFNRNKISLPPVDQRLTFIFIIYIFLNVLSIIFSINKNESFYEWLRFLIFFLFYMCLLIILHKKDEILPVIIKNINIAILIFSAFGFWQIYPVIADFFLKDKPIEIKLSLSSTLGNKNFYSETLLVALPFVVCGISVFKKFWKGFSMFNSILILINIFILQTVSVWLGLLAGIFLLVISYRKKLFARKGSLGESKKVKTGAVAALIFVIVITGVVISSKPVFFNAIWKKAAMGLKYIKDPGAMEEFSLENNNSTYERIILWRNSFKMIREHPFFGVGLGEWKIYFPKYGMGKAPYMNSGTIRFEKPHNDFLLVACETGLPGLICYLVLFIVSFRCCRKIIQQTQNEKDKLLLRLMTAGLAGFMVISFFGFPGQRPFTMIFLMLILAVIQSKYLQLFPAKGNAKIKKIYRLLFISGILVSAYALNIGIKRLKAEMHLSNALRAQKIRSWGTMMRETNLAKSPFFQMDYTSTPVNWYIGFANFYAGNQEQAFINFKEAEKINPWHFNVLNDLGTCYNLQGNTEMAKVYYQKATHIASLFPDAILNLSVIYYNSGNIDSAYAVISRCELKGGVNYNKNLKAILYSKAQNTLQQIGDTALRDRLSAKINDEKWLLSVHEEAQKSKDTFKDVLLKMGK